MRRNKPYIPTRPFNKDGTPRKRRVPAEGLAIAEGFVPLNVSLTGPLRHCMGRYQIPAKANHFTLGMDWSEVWGDWERFPALLIRSMLVVIGHFQAEYPFTGMREKTLKLLSYLFSQKGKIGKMCPSRKEGISPGYVVFCVTRILDSDDKEWEQVVPEEALLDAAMRMSVLRLGKPEAPFVVADELALVLCLAGSDGLWKPMSGIRRPVLDAYHDNCARRALLSSVAKPTWEIGLPGRKLYCGNDKFLTRGRKVGDSRRVEKLFVALDNPEEHLYESVAELVVVQDWLRANRTRFLKLYLRPGGEHMVNAGAILEWLFGESLPALTAVAVKA